MDAATLTANATTYLKQAHSAGKRGRFTYGVLGLVIGLAAFALSSVVTEFSGMSGRVIALIGFALLGVLFGGIIGYLVGIRRMLRESLVNSDFLDRACEQAIERSLSRISRPGQPDPSLSQVPRELEIEARQYASLAKESAPEQRGPWFLRGIIARVSRSPESAIGHCLLRLSKQIARAANSDSELLAQLGRLPIHLKNLVNTSIERAIKRIFFYPFLITYVISVTIFALWFLVVVIS